MWCGGVVCMTTLRQWDSRRYQVDKIPPYLLSLRVTRVYAFSQVSHSHSHTEAQIFNWFLSKYYRDLRNIYSQSPGERWEVLYWRSCERQAELLSSISLGNNSCIPWSFLSKNVVMTMPWWVVNLELCDRQWAGLGWRDLFLHQGVGRSSSQRKIAFTDKCCGWFIHKGEIDFQFWDKLLVQSQIIRGEVMPGEAERNQQNLHQLLPTRNWKNP